MADLSNKKISEIYDRINRWSLVPSGTEGFDKAEVSGGGIDTAEMEEEKHFFGLPNEKTNITKKLI